MASDPILHLLGLARKAGKLELGEEPVGAACRARQARVRGYSAGTSIAVSRRIGVSAATKTVLDRKIASSTSWVMKRIVL